MDSKDYEVLVNRLVIENNKIKDKIKKWNEERNVEMAEVGRTALKHNDETIEFIKKLDKEG